MSTRQVIVQAGGVDFTGDTLANVQVDMGARTPWEQNVGDLATVIIQQDDPGILIGEDLTILVESPDTPEATGGTESTITVDGVVYRLHVFTSDGTFTVTSPGEVEYLIVGGGGGSAHGGGGAGGFLTGTVAVSPDSYPVVVGAGGAGRLSSQTVTAANDGGNSSFAGITAYGGGAGGGNRFGVGRDGGSGGGSGYDTTNPAAATSGTPGQGNGGGISNRTAFGAGGGGGGAGGAGTNGTTQATTIGLGGNGGPGLASTITGTSVYYAGGGGAGANFAGATLPTGGGVGGIGGGGSGALTLDGNGSPGTDGLGGGAGGGEPNGGSGANGGSGVVIIRYRDSYQPVFTGRVDTTSAELTSLGPLWTVTGSGPLTRAGRQNLTSVIAADTDGDQIALLAQEALAVEWEEAGGTWAAQTATWDGFAVDTSAIDQPGQYALAAITSVPTNVVEVMSTAAFSGSGWLYETRDGLLGFADSTHRELLPASEYIVVPGAATSRNAFVTVTQESDVANEIIVEYDGGDVTGKANDSIQTYGRWQRTYTTTLADASAASDFLTRRLNLEGSPRLNVAGTVTIALDQVTDALYDQLLTVERNTGIILEDVPTYLAAEGVYRGFVEGYRWSLGPVESFLDLYVSEYSLSSFGLRWNAVGPAAWADVAATLTWQNATEALA